ncbi:WD-40 repeat-containing protein [Crinalium epipsammum PCC 9333]|uniref:WD40 repeat-containing protein SMU1 n=1 Tax=Crinalium epipsammum PCC 9333 TaxID=1173022 RepID=K9W457_9CYAN|nr:hypothetical protein [Crinalium epipsammum]AFZ14569.1 WD-40 repeat-containing protein [Crinalium epipsammum PCC 9333]
MNRTEEPEDINVFNENSLKALVRAIRLSQGQFSLILARCNYAALRDRMAQRLKELSPVPIEEISLDQLTKTLYTGIQEKLGSEQPQALRVFGLDAVVNMESLLTSANQVREEFRLSFPFPLILWVNDEVLKKLRRLARDFESWATITEFKLSQDELLKFLRQQTDGVFKSPKLNLAICQEIKAAFQECQSCEQLLEPDLQASEKFILGIENYFNNRLDDALNNYQKSLAYWQQSDNLERQEKILIDIAVCYEDKAEQNRLSSRQYWQESKNYLQQCINLFEQAKRLDVVSQHINKLGRILRRLEAWAELQILAEKAIALHQQDNNFSELAENYGFLAEVALNQSDWEKAKELAQQSLQTLEKVTDITYGRGLYQFLLARSQQHLNQTSEAINNLEKALEESNPEYDPQFYINILENLRFLSYQQNKYLEAFKFKQQQRAIESQYRFRPFIGAIRLEPLKRAINTSLESPDINIKEREKIIAASLQQDVKILINKLSRNDQRLIIIHGISGVGKSSLLLAGLVPALEKQIIDSRNALPVLVRVYTNWLRELSFWLKKRLNQSNLNPDTASLEAIIKQLKQNVEQNLLTVLIFDQFEEFFFACTEIVERRKLYEFIRVCLDIPFVKVILSLREDYLHYLLDFNRLITLDVINQNILDKNILYYLGNFSVERTKAVIRELTDGSQFRLPEELIEQLVKDLAGAAGEVRPIELQVVGAQLQTENINTLEKYQQLGENPKEKLVEKSLEEVITDCGGQQEDIARLVLYFLTNENGTRPLKTRDELAKDLEAAGLKIDSLRPPQPPLERGEYEQPISLDLVLEILVGSGIVFLVPDFPANRYQLVHDYLVPFIRQQQEAGLLAQLRQEAEYQKKRAEDLQRSQIDALSRYADALWQSHQELDALREAIRAGVTLKQIDGIKTDTRVRVVTALQQVVYGIRERNRFAGHSSSVKSVTFSPDGQTIASASNDNTVKLWNLAGRELQTLTGHSSPVKSVTFSPDGQTIASASNDNTVKLWNLAGWELQTLTGHSSPVNSVAFSPDGQTIASASNDKTVKLWNLASRELKTLTGHSSYVYSVAFSPDGQTIASASNDKTVKLWNLAGRELKTLTGHSSYVYSVAFSPDGQTIASASNDNTVKLWNLAGRELKTLTGHGNAVNSVAFSPDGQTIASANNDNTVKLWNLAGRELQTLTGHGTAVKSVAFSPDGQTIASASWDKTVKLWNLAGRELQTLTGHGSYVYSVTFSPDGQTIASASNDKTVKLWNLAGQELQTLTGHSSYVYSVAFSPDGRTIASASWDKTVKLWNLAGRELQTLTGHSDYVNSVAFSPDGQTIASASNDKTVKLWNLAGRELQTLTGHSDYVNSVAFSPDGQTIASASWDNTVDLDDLLLKGCNWAHDYLQNNPNVEESDRHLCDGISSKGKL